MKTIAQISLTMLAALLWVSSPSANITGNTSPTFLFAPQASTGLAPYAVELADMDGDGDKDLVTSNVVDQEFSTVSVSKNNGDGTFATPVDYSVGPNPTDLRLADFNGDGKPDVICIAALSGDDGSTSYVTVLFNNGIGGLINRQDYPVGENANSGGVDVGDYDGDGDIDFAIASLLEGVHVYRNTGSGTFTLWAHFAISLSPTHIASADFNSDGRLDLLVGDTDAVQVYLNNGAGFAGGIYIDNYPDSVRGLATGDFDNDGKPDFVTTGRSLSVFRNLGGGTSFAKTAYLAGENQVNVKTADMDGDGYLDITVSNYLANSVSVYSNDGTGHFADKREWGVGMAPNSHGIGDVNGDGKLDIVAAASQLDQTTVNVVLNAGNRTYLARRDYGMLGAANGVGFADFNRDGHRDVVSVVYVSNADGPFVFYGKPDGTLQDGVQIENWGNNIPTDVAVGDFNGDSWPDFVSSIFSPGDSIRVSLNRGDGTFLPSVVYEAGGNPSGVAVGDLNGDGKLDIVNSNGSQLDNDISIFIGNGNGTFQPQVRVPVGFRPGGVLLADFDQNGRSEVVVTHYGSNAIYYFKPNAAGVLGPPEIINIGSTQGNAVAADFDNDGWLDIMVGAGNAVLLRNNQSGGFLPLLATPVPAGYIAAGDWDQDGLMDIVGTNGVLDLALVGWNHGGGNFTYVNSLQSGYGTGRAGAADLNSDGFPEIVTCNGRARSISVFKNMMASGPTPSPTPTPTPTPTPPPPTPTPTPTPVPTPTPTPTSITISGTISYCSNPVPGPIPNVTLNLTGTMSGTTLSDNFGNYTFSSLPSGGSYTVTPSKTALPPASAGIDTVDVIALQRHFLVLGTPLTGCRLTAADVDLNSSINTVDVIAVQRFFLGLSTGIAQTGKYQFSPTSRTYTGLVRSQTAENYDTLVFGDVAAGFVESVDDPLSAPGDRMSASEMAATVATVALPEVAVDQSKSKFIAAVKTSTIDAKNELVGFQGDFAFDERVIAFQNEPVQKAGLTGGNWNVSGNVLPGAGPIRTLRISAYSNDFTALSGEGTLFELRMTRVSKAAQSTQLLWLARPGQFIFIDADLRTQKPGSVTSYAVAAHTGDLTVLPLVDETVTVTTLDDLVDFSGSQQVSDLPGPDGRVSFREAVTAANNTPGPQTIAFAISPAEFWLVPEMGLLRLEQGAFFLNDSGTTVDFSTQTVNMGDTNPNGPEIGIYGLEPNGWGIAAIFVNGDNCVVKGLGKVYQRGYAVRIVGDNNRVISCQIDGPFNAAVSIQGYISGPTPSGNIVGGTGPGEGNILIGLNIDGPAEGNIVIGNSLLVGVEVRGATQYGVIARNNRIGGPTSAERNVISGAGSYGEEGFPDGAQVSIIDADGTLVEGNYIGTTADGMARYPQQIGPTGVEVRDSRNTTIRANLVAGLRVVGANHYAGQIFGQAIHVGAINANTRDTVIQGNTIGLAADGLTPIVTRSGVTVSPLSSFYHAFGTLIASNHIASVETTGVVVTSLENGVTITGNSIHDCGALGIDLFSNSGGGVTPNDPGDGDTGGNGLQNFPVLLSAATTGSAVMFQGTLDSSPSTQFTVEFFASPSCDSSGFGEGAVFIGSTQVTTDGAGHVAFSLTLPAAVAVNATATATATRLSTGDTSEFSACVAVTSAPTPSPTPTSITISGIVSYCSNPVPGPIPNVTLNLTGTMSGTTLSDASGNYQFSSLASGGSYTVTPSKTALTPASAGIDTVDVIALQRHFLVLGTPLLGCRLTAADVDLNSSINTVDVIAVQRFFLGLSTGIANTGKYQFTPANRTYTGLVSSQIGQSYDTLVFGDVTAGFVEGVDDPSQTAPGDGMRAGVVPVPVAAVALPEVALDQSMSNFIAAVTTSAIDAKDKLVGFQGDFTFDERVVTFQDQAVQKAGLTGGNWNVSGNVLPGAGPIRTLRISAYSNDFTPLSGEGTLFELRMTRVSQTAQGTSLLWAPALDQFVFIDADLNTQKPGYAAPGSIAPFGKRK